MAHIHTILVPCDGSPPSIAALYEATLLADDLGASIDVLRVRVRDHFEVGSTPPATESEHERAARDLERALDDVKRTLGERVRLRAVDGDPLRTILETASDGYDLVVMGTHGRVGRLHALLGSVTEEVVRSAPCPVLTVRESNGEESFAEERHGRESLAEQTR